jgi:hypothetical protein
VTARHEKYSADGISGFVNDLNGAVRKNPIAAGLVGTGILWMFFGGSRVFDFGKALPAAGTQVSGAVSAAAAATRGAVGGALSGTASRVNDASRHVADAIAASADNAATTLHDAASAGIEAFSPNGDGVRTMVRADRESGTTSDVTGGGLGNSLQQNLTTAFGRQPLFLGAIGLAIGAGLASSLPSTEIEQDLMGEAGTAVKDRIQETAEFASERVQHILEDVKKEVAAQGLTPAAAKEGFKGLGEKVKSAATNSGDAIKHRLS